MLAASLLPHQAPSLLLVRDVAGHVFGGFAAAPWEKAGAYFGDFSTFVFRLLPAAQVMEVIEVMEVIGGTPTFWQLSNPDLGR